MLDFLFPQAIDDETHAQVVLTWRVFYVPTEHGFCIMDVEVDKMHVEIPPRYKCELPHKFPASVQLADRSGIAELERIARPGLCEEILLERCLEDWERIGKDLWHEMKGAA